MKYRFKSKNAYYKWCAETCQRIKTSCIAMNNVGIKSAVSEIDSKLYLPEDTELYKT